MEMIRAIVVELSGKRGNICKKKIMSLKQTARTKNIRHFYGGINEFPKCFRN
jgi:hypothetical protein